MGIIRVPSKDGTKDIIVHADVDTALRWYPDPRDMADMHGYPFEARLISEPDSEYAREHMTVGQTYTVFGWAGSCYEVSTNVPDDKTMIWNGRLQPI